LNIRRSIIELHRAKLKKLDIVPLWWKLSGTLGDWSLNLVEQRLKVWYCLIVLGVSCILGGQSLNLLGGMSKGWHYPIISRIRYILGSIKSWEPLM